MLTENQVVDAVCARLKDLGYKIESFCHDTQKGDDVVAVNPEGYYLRIECKGSMSKEGKEYDKGYLWQAAAGAFFNTVRANETAPPKTAYGIAIPDTDRFAALFDDLRFFFHNNNIPVFWVTDSATIRLWGAI